MSRQTSKMSEDNIIQNIVIPRIAGYVQHCLPVPHAVSTTPINMNNVRKEFRPRLDAMRSILGFSDEQIEQLRGRIATATSHIDFNSTDAFSQLTPILSNFTMEIVNEMSEETLEASMDLLS